MARGQRLYEDRCADCHGLRGQGATGAYPALDGNRKVTMRNASNAVRLVVEGGFPPTTAGNNLQANQISLLARSPGQHALHD